jgi:hypothetical protein
MVAKQRIVISLTTSPDPRGSLNSTEARIVVRLPRSEGSQIFRCHMG